MAYVVTHQHGGISCVKKYKEGHPKTEFCLGYIQFSLPNSIQSETVSLFSFSLFQSHAFLQNLSPLLSPFHLPTPSLSVSEKNAIRVQHWRRRRRWGSAGFLHRRREIDRQQHEQPPFSASIPPIPTPRAIYGQHHFPDRSPNTQPSQSHRKADARRVSIPSATKPLPESDKPAQSLSALTQAQNSNKFPALLPNLNFITN